MASFDKIMSPDLSKTDQDRPSKGHESVRHNRPGPGDVDGSNTTGQEWRRQL